MIFLKQGCQHESNPTSIKAKESLVSQDFLGTVKAVLVHELSYEGASGALVLHAGLDQVYGVHSCGPSGYKHTHTGLNCIHANAYIILLNQQKVCICRGHGKGFS